MSLAGLGLLVACAAAGAGAAGPFTGWSQIEALPRYPLGRLALPDFLARGDPLRLSDLRFRSDGGDEHALLARVRFLDLGYASFELADGGTRLAFDSHRLSLAAEEAGDDWRLGASYRTRRGILFGDARSQRGGRDWVLGPTLQLKLGDDVSLVGWLEASTARPKGRSLTELGAEALWQRGAWLEAQLRYARSYVVTAAGDENRVDVARASLVAQLARAEVSAFGLLEDVAGRFPRTEAEPALGLRLPVFGRLLLEADASGRFDTEAGALRHGLGGSLAWHGRRVTLPRAGRAAEAAVALARAANAAGEYELRAFDDDALRGQRERLSLSRHAPELVAAMEDVYRAQVRERNLPLVGVALRRHENVLTGERVSSLGLLLGVPWPAAWPWSRSEAGVPFLTLQLGRDWTETASRFRSEADRAALTVSLSREMDLVLRYRHAEPTALEVVRGVGTRRRFSLECVYARAR